MDPSMTMTNLVTIIQGHPDSVSIPEKPHQVLPESDINVDAQQGSPEVVYGRPIQPPVFAFGGNISSAAVQTGIGRRHAPSPSLTTESRSESTQAGVQTRERGTDADAPTTRVSEMQTECPNMEIPADTFTGEDITCSICLSRFAPRDIVCRISCRHMFHRSCWDTHCAHHAEKHQGNLADLDCPVCRGKDVMLAHWEYVDPKLLTQPNRLGGQVHRCGREDMTEIHHLAVETCLAQVQPVADPGAKSVRPVSRGNRVTIVPPGVVVGKQSLQVPIAALD